MLESDFFKLTEITTKEIEVLKRNPTHKILIIPTVEEMEELKISDNFDKYGRFLIFLSNYMKFYNENRIFDEDEKASLRYINDVIYNNINWEN